jgi:biotin carboxylase
VIKPVDASGQLGLHIINDFNAVESCFVDALCFSVAGEVIIEEWLKGSEVNVVGIVLGGEIRSMIISDREKHPTEAFGVVQRHVYPANISDEQRRSIEDLCRHVVLALEIQNGIIFPQIIVTERGPIMAEFGERIPGGIMREVFEFSTGYNLVNLQIDISLDQIRPLSAYRTEQASPAVVVKFLNCQPGPLKPGKVANILHREEVLAMDGIRVAQFFTDPAKPQEIRPLRKSADRFFYVVAVGSDREQAMARSEAAASSIDFLDSNGASLKV